VYTPAGRLGSRHSLRDAPAVIKPPADDEPEVVVVVGMVVVGSVVGVVEGGDVVVVVDVDVVPTTPRKGNVVVVELVGR
jgi:hypothetical protein